MGESDLEGSSHRGLDRLTACTLEQAVSQGRRSNGIAPYESSLLTQCVMHCLPGLRIGPAAES